MKFYRCVNAWKRHAAGEVIPEHEYNRLPFEIKQHKNFELIDDAVIAGVGESEGTAGGQIELPITGGAPEIDIPATADAIKAIDALPDGHRYANRSKRN